MNDADVLRYADRFAARLLALGGDDDARIARAFELALGRAPSAKETGAVRSFLAGYARLGPAPEPDDDGRGERRRDRRRPPGARARTGLPGDEAPPPLADPRHAAWSAFAQSLFQSAEFRTID